MIDENETVFTLKQGNDERCLNLKCGLEHLRAALSQNQCELY